MTLHTLKIYSEYYDAVRNGIKTFEIRKNDRDYKVGDTLRLREYDPDLETRFAYASTTPTWRPTWMRRDSRGGM